MIAPEGVEDFGKGCKLLVPLHEQRAAGVEDLVTRLEIDVRERFGQIEDAPDRNLEAHPAQEPAEHDEVVLETTACQLLTPNAHSEACGPGLVLPTATQERAPLLQFPTHTPKGASGATPLRSGLTHARLLNARQ